MTKKVIKPFDLEKAKNGAEICTRDGRKARVVCWDRKNKNYPILALITNEDDEEASIAGYTSTGKFYTNDNASLDLMLVEYEEEQHKFEVFDKVLVRDAEDDVWTPAFYADYDEKLYKPYLVIGCMGSSFKQCIPFEGNENLSGTTRNPE